MSQVMHVEIHLPDGWWLDSLSEVRTKVIYANDRHKPTGEWKCALQHERGGHLIEAKGQTPQAAIDAAIVAIAKAIESGRWYDGEEL